MDQTDCHQQGLYRPEFEHDSCGTGFITNINGHKSNQIVNDALTILREHGTPWRLRLRS
jgi:glutamate synthase (NADPH/NADH) large chain